MYKKTLEKDQIILFKRGIRNILCQDGRLWINWKRGKDIQLLPGEFFNGRKFKYIQIHALEKSLLFIEYSGMASIFINFLKRMKTTQKTVNRPIKNDYA